MEKATQPKERRRRAPVASPSARRITFTGVMAVPDDFGRLRVLLVEHTADGDPDGSWAALAREIPRAANASMPYDLWEPDADGIRGVARVAVPERYRAHWGRIAEDLRGQEVRVEATVRPFVYRLNPEPGPEPAPPQTVVVGAALDLALLAPRPRVGAL